MSASGASAATGSAIDNAIVIDLDEDEVKAVVKEFDDSALKEAAYARAAPELDAAGKRIKEAVENAKNFERGMTHQDDEDPVQLEALLEVVRQRIEEATHVWADTLAAEEGLWYPHPINARDHGRVTPAHTCAGSAVPLTLQVLLDTYLVDLNQRNQFGETPLTRLLSYGRLARGRRSAPTSSSTTWRARTPSTRRCPRRCWRWPSCGTWASTCSSRSSRPGAPRARGARGPAERAAGRCDDRKRPAEPEPEAAPMSEKARGSGPCDRARVYVLITMGAVAF